MIPVLIDSAPEIDNLLPTDVGAQLGVLLGTIAEVPLKQFLDGLITWSQGYHKRMPPGLSNDGPALCAAKIDQPVFYVSKNEYFNLNTQIYPLGSLLFINIIFASF